MESVGTPFSSVFVLLDAHAYPRASISALPRAVAEVSERVSVEAVAIFGCFALIFSSDRRTREGATFAFLSAHRNCCYSPKDSICFFSETLLFKLRAKAFHGEEGGIERANLKRGFLAFRKSTTALTTSRHPNASRSASARRTTSSTFQHYLPTSLQFVTTSTTIACPLDTHSIDLDAPAAIHRANHPMPSESRR